MDDIHVLKSILSNNNALSALEIESMKRVIDNIENNRIYPVINNLENIVNVDNEVNDKSVLVYDSKVKTWMNSPIINNMEYLYKYMVSQQPLPLLMYNSSSLSNNSVFDLSVMKNNGLATSELYVEEGKIVMNNGSIVLPSMNMFNEDFTIDIVFEYKEKTGQWGRLFDFGNGSNSGVFYSGAFGNTNTFFLSQRNVFLHRITNFLKTNEKLFVSISYIKSDKSFKIYYYNSDYDRIQEDNVYSTEELQNPIPYCYLSKSSWVWDGMMNYDLHAFSIYKGASSKANVIDRFNAIENKFNSDGIISSSGLMTRYQPLTQYANYISIEPIYTSSALSILYADIGVVESGNNKSTWNPTRNVITPDGSLMFVTYLNGSTLVFYKDVNNNWKLQDRVFYDIGLIGTSGEAGLCGLILSENFNITSGLDSEKYMFLTYQIVIEGIGYNKISRITFDYQNGTAIGKDAIEIYSMNKYASAHQIMNGWCNNSKLHVVVGDLFDAEESQNMESDLGKILSMDYDGNSKKVVALGTRDPFNVIKLDESQDIHRRVVGCGNGTNVARMFVSCIDDSYETPVNLGWSGEDDGLDWSYALDSNYPSSLKPNAIIKTWENDPSPNGLAIFKNNCDLFNNDTILTKPTDNVQVTGLMSFHGRTYDFGTRVSPLPGQTICSIVIKNLSGPQVHFSYEPIIELKEEYRLSYNSPLTISIDPTDGSAVFIDVYTGEISKIEFKNI